MRLKNPSPITQSLPDPYAALRFRDYRLFAFGNLASIMGQQMLSVAIGWELYERTHSALSLGIVGLVQVLPVIFLALPAGHAADQFDRRMIVMMTQGVLALCSVGLAVISYQQSLVILIYLCLFAIGIARAFNNPARAALLPQIVPKEIFSNAVTWNSSGFQLAAMLGPALAGLLIAMQKSATSVYVCCALTALVFFGCLFFIRGRQAERSTEPVTIKSLVAGFHFVWQTKIILAALTLDLFAVLLGGATTLLPIFAKDILQVGPDGLGWLRAAPAIGAFMMALAITHLPTMNQAGKTLLWAVGGFGAATIGFGLSHSFWFSLFMLACIGALDSISVVVRQTLVQLRTPDEMRGRVSAVNGMFISSSNELGGFESGVAASLFGPVLAVVGGGIGTIAVVMAVALIWPEIRKLKSLVPD
ncbi:MAG: MFS transporter [Gloeobacterales cyanobacterium]